MRHEFRVLFMDNINPADQFCFDWNIRKKIPSKGSLAKKSSDLNAIAKVISDSSK